MSEAIRVQLKHLLSVSDAEFAASLAASASDSAPIPGAGASSTSTPLTSQNRASSAASSLRRPASTLPVEQLAALVKTALKTDASEDLSDSLHELEQQREKEMLALCDTAGGPLRGSLGQLDAVAARAAALRHTVRELGRRSERSAGALLEARARHVATQRTRQNVESALNIVKLCLAALEHTNQVEALLKSGHRAAAVQNLQEVQSMELDELQHMGMGALIAQAADKLSREITKATLGGTDTYLLVTPGAANATDSEFWGHIESVGERSYALLERQQRAWAAAVAQHRHLRPFRLNSAVERAYRRSNHNFLTISQLGVNLGPLFEAEMVFRKLGTPEPLVQHVDARLAAAAEQFVRVSAPAELLQLLPALVGLCLFDRALSKYLPNVRPAKMVDDAWERLARHLSRVLGRSLGAADDVMPLKTELGRVMDVLSNFRFNVAIVGDLLRTLLAKASRQVVSAARLEFKQRWESGDQMQLVVATPEEYDEVLRDVWYKPEKFDGNVALPHSFPFSEVYLLLSRRLKALLDAGNSFLDYFQSDPGFVENTVARAADEVLGFAASELGKVGIGHNRELIVQSMVNLQLLGLAAGGIEKQLSKMRETTGRRGTVALEATPVLAKAAKQLETRIYVLLEETVANFFESSSFDWQATEEVDTPSSAVLEMTTYLLTLTNTILKRLPPDVRLLAMFNLTEHVGTGMRDSVYAAASVTPVAVANFDVDLKFLETSLLQVTEQPTPSDAMAEAREIVDLLRAENPAEEYNDVKVRNRKYARVSAANAAALVKKLRREGEEEEKSGWRRWRD